MDDVDCSGPSFLRSPTNLRAYGADDDKAHPAISVLHSVRVTLINHYWVTSDERRRVLLAVERYKKGEASLGRAAELAGVPLGQMMTILTDFGVESRIEDEDYLQGLAALRKAW